MSAERIDVLAVTKRWMHYLPASGTEEMVEVSKATAECIRLLKRVQYVRGLTGNAKAQAWDKLDREIDAALARIGGAS